MVYIRSSRRFRFLIFSATIKNVVIARPPDAAPVVLRFNYDHSLYQGRSRLLMTQTNQCCTTYMYFSELGERRTVENTDECTGAPNASLTFQILCCFVSR